MEKGESKKEILGDVVKRFTGGSSFPVIKS